MKSVLMAVLMTVAGQAFALSVRNLDVKGSVALPAGALDTNPIATDAVTNAKILDGAVQTSKLGSDAVTTAKVADGAINTAKLGSAAVTAAKIATTTSDSGKILTSCAGGVMWRTGGTCP